MRGGSHVAQTHSAVMRSTLARSRLIENPRIRLPSTRAAQEHMRHVPHVHDTRRRPLALPSSTMFRYHSSGTCWSHRSDASAHPHPHFEARPRDSTGPCSDMTLPRLDSSRIAAVHMMLPDAATSGGRLSEVKSINQSYSPRMRLPSGSKGDLRCSVAGSGGCCLLLTAQVPARSHLGVIFGRSGGQST